MPGPTANVMACDEPLPMQQLRRSLALEREARLQAEALLRNRSLALIERTRALERLNSELTADVATRAAELAQARDEAVRASAAKSAFLAHMSHEIRTPMNAIIGMTDLALDCPMPADQRELLAVVRAAGEQLLEIVNDVLDLSAIESGEMALEPSQFALAPCVELACRSLAPRAADKGLDLRCTLATDLPSHFFADVFRLRQVLLNLLSNAVKFTPQGHVHLSAQSVGAGVAFRVEDTGIGIAADQLDRIFKPFAQADDSLTRRFGGTGLGLSICRDLVQRMGGHLSVRSTEGQGSCFEFWLPRTAPATPAMGDEPQRPSKTQRPSPLPADEASPEAGRHILVVDDKEINRLLCQRLLSSQGHQVTLAEDGRRAVALVRSAPFDLVLMDLQMPVMDGLEATRCIRNDPSAQVASTPIVALTAHTAPVDRERCLDAGMNDHLGKPISRVALDEVVRRHARPHRLAVQGVGQEGRDSASVPVPEGPVDVSLALKHLGGDQELYAELVDMFLGEVAQDIDRLAQAQAQAPQVQAPDLAQDALGRVAHALKGALLALGAQAAADCASRLEAACRAPEAAPLQQAAAGLAEALAGVQVWLRAWRQAPGPGGAA